MQEQLAIHRDQQACNACHRRIDPMGIALETFDPIGRLRERYPKVDNGSREGPVIETSAVLASGREIKNVLEFKAMLVEQEKQFTKCLTEKLLTYATGRHLEPSDRGEVDRIIKSLEKDGNRLRHLITRLFKVIFSWLNNHQKLRHFDHPFLAYEFCHTAGTVVWIMVRKSSVCQPLIH